MNALSLPAPQVSPTEVPDRVAIQAVIAGDKEMFRIIVRRYNAQLYRVGMAYLRHHAQTEDAMQNTYLKAFTHLRRFNGQASFGTWLTRIMINECLMMIRRVKRVSLEALTDNMVPYDETAATRPAHDSLLHGEMKTVLESAIQALPRVHRSVYMLREVQHLSTDETAACLGMTAANVKVCLHRAREGLKAQLLKSAAGVELFDYSADYCDPMTTRVMTAILGQASS